ncbi:response regulator transcription factor [Patescibacteria group bacterium]
MQKSVLLVEDDPFLIDIYSIKLKEAGFSVDVVEDGEMVIKKIKEKIPDVLMLDIVLPKINGWEIMKRMKKDNQLKNIPVIFLSNLGQKEDVEKGLNLGATKYLIKAHYTPSEVVEEIEKIIKN